MSDSKERNTAELSESLSKCRDFGGVPAKKGLTYKSDYATSIGRKVFKLIDYAFYSYKSKLLKF